MKKDGKADSTIETAISRLKQLSTLCNIDEPEQVKTILATLKWKNNTKHNVTQIYNGYIKYIGKTWTQPKYTKESQIPFIPTETEIDTLISAGTRKTSTLLQLLKETGARIGEIEKLLWTHMDNERKTIYITAEKGSNSRILPISTKLTAMLNNLTKTNERIFQTNRHALRTTFESLRNRTAIKLNNPRLKKIHFHTFRHWKGTMEYHKTKDIIHVKTVLGHKNIESTMTYINIEQALFLEQSDEWTCKTANNINEATQLIETGFEYITEMDNIKLFRKRK
jgi:integrase